MLTFAVVIFSLAALLVGADVLQTAYPVIGGTAILNSIVELITRKQSQEKHQEIIALIFEQHIFSNASFNTDIQDYKKITDNLNSEIKKLLELGRISKDRKKKIGSTVQNLNDDEFGRIYNGMNNLGKILNNIDTRFSEGNNSTLTEKEHLGSVLIKFNKELHKFEATLEKIDNPYRNFMEYSKDITLVSNQTLLGYTTTILNDNSTISKLNDLQSFLTKEGTLLQLFLKQGVETHIVCQIGKTPQQLVYNLYHNAIIAELKVLLMRSFVRAVQSHLNINNSGRNVSENQAKTTLERVNYLNNIFTSFLMSNRLERQLYRCNSPSIDKEDEYYQYKNFLQTVFVRSKTFGRNHEVLLGHRRCAGRLYGCKQAGKWTTPNVCLNQYKTRRYDYLSFTTSDKVNPNKVSIVKYGRQCSNPTEIPENTTYDICLCDATEEKDQERYISLDIVKSDAENDMVVTGVKLVKHSNGVGFQIQQAKLAPGGAVDPSTAHWVEDGKTQIENSFELLQNRRRINLDIFNGEPGFVVTGVKFSKLTDGVTMEVEVTSFNSSTGKLDRNNAKWLRNDNSARERQPIHLASVYPPSDAKSRAFIQSKTNYFIQFDVTGLSEDIGQTLVPFFDTRPVYSASLAPLSGMGIHYKSAGSRYGGYIGPVLVGLNYIDNMEKGIQEDVSSISIPIVEREAIAVIQPSEKSSSVNCRIPNLLYVFVIVLYM